MSRQRNFLEAISDRKVPVTCRYWLNGRCFNNADRCSYLHGYICREDGDCRAPDCSDIHLKQRDPFHSRPRRHSRSRSRSMSPRFRHRRNYKSPPRGKSGRGYGPSRSQSRSPRRRVVRSRSRSPKRRISRSPRRYSRSRTKSPRRRNSRSFSRGRSSRSPRHQSRSPQFERRSPAEFQEKGQFQPQGRFEDVSLEFHKNSCSSARTREIKEVESPLVLEDVLLDEGSHAPSKLVVLDDIEDGQILTPERQPECVVLDENGDELICPTDEEVEVLNTTSKSKLPNKIARRPRREPSISELTDRIASDFMKPETQALLKNILKLTTEESSKITKEGSTSPDPLIMEKILDEMAVDLEEVGEEVDDYFGSTAAEAEPSLGGHLKAAANPSPPKARDKPLAVSKRQSDVLSRADYHTDWELKVALENPGKPLEKAVNIPFRPPPVEKNRGNKLNSSSLWTPALDRRQVAEAKMKMAYQAGRSNWEVETPYIARNTKKDAVQLGAAPTSEQNGKPTQSEFKNPTVKQGRSSESTHKPAASSKKEPSPCEAATPKVTEETQSSKVLPAGEKKSEEMEILAKEKATLLNEIKTLESQRSNLQEQKSSIIRSHKGDKRSLDELLGENLFLYDEIGKEIKKRSDKVLRLNVTLIRAMKMGKVRKAGRSQSKSPDSSHRQGSMLDDHCPFKSRKVKPKDRDSPEHAPRFRSSKHTREVSRSPEYSTSKRDMDYARSPERRAKKHGRNYSRSPESSHSKFGGDYFRSPERSGSRFSRGYSRSPERNVPNRVREYSRSPERGSSKRVRNYSRTPERTASKRAREYSSRSPERNLSKRRSDYSRSPERSYRNRRSPTHKSHRSPKNTRSVRSPKRNGGRSRSPDNDYKRPSSPESSRSKLLKSSGPSLVKIQKSHWARSHIMGTLEKFKKELFAEVDIPYAPNEKATDQDDANVDTCEVPDSRLGYPKQPEKEVAKDPKAFRDDNSVERKFDAFDEDERPVSRSPSSFGETGLDGPYEFDRMPQPGTSQSKSQYRVMDVGMHWCRLCDLVFETLPMYCNHLLSSPHLAKLKNNPKPWLARATKEEKKPLPPDTKTITVPVLGSEFLHSLPVVYCSLCNVFLRDVAEAVKHPECDFHIASYKAYRENYSSKVESYWKAHSAALTRHKLSGGKKDPKVDAKDAVSQQIEGRLLREIKAKREREGKQEERSKDGEDKPSYVSIKVASREHRPSAQKFKDDGSGSGAEHKEKSHANESRGNFSKDGKSQTKEDGESIATEGKIQPKKSREYFPKGSKSQLKDLFEKLSKESKQQIKENEIFPGRSSAKSSDAVKEKVGEKLAESKDRDEIDKLKSASSQDKQVKDSVSGLCVKFPLFGKMPSFRKKINVKKPVGNSSKDPMSSESKVPESFTCEMFNCEEDFSYEGIVSHYSKSDAQDGEKIEGQESRLEPKVSRNDCENVNAIKEGGSCEASDKRGNDVQNTFEDEETEELTSEGRDLMVSDMELEDASSSEQEAERESNADLQSTKDKDHKKSDGADFKNSSSKPDEIEPSDVSSATVEALQLLNIPLPGFEPSSKKANVSDLVSLESNDDIDTHQVMEIPLPPPGATAKNVELDELNPFSLRPQIEARPISYGCEIQNEIPLPLPIPAAESVVLDSMNPFSHGMQIDTGMIYGSDVQNIIPLESSCPEMPFSSHESLSSFPCRSREFTPPPPGTETESDMQDEIMSFMEEEENSTPPPPGTEPSILVESPLISLTNKRSDAEKSVKMVKPLKVNECLKQAKSTLVPFDKKGPISAETEQLFSETGSDSRLGKGNVVPKATCDFAGTSVSKEDAAKGTLSPSEAKGSDVTDVEKLPEREISDTPTSQEEGANVKENLKESLPADKINECSSDVKTSNENKVVSDNVVPNGSKRNSYQRICSKETDISTKSNVSGRSLSKIDLNMHIGDTTKKAACDLEFEEKKDLCGEKPLGDYTSRTEDQVTDEDSSEDKVASGSEKILDQMVFDTEVNDTTNTRSEKTGSSCSEKDIDLDSGTLETKIACVERNEERETYLLGNKPPNELESSPKDLGVPCDNSRKSFTPSEEKSVNHIVDESLEATSCPKRTTRNKKPDVAEENDKRKVKDSTKSVIEKSSSEEKRSGDSCESNTEEDTPTNEFARDNSPDLTKNSKSLPKDSVTCPVRRSGRNANHEAAKVDGSRKEQHLPSRRSSRNAKLSSATENADNQKLLEIQEEKCEEEEKPEVGSDSSEKEEELPELPPPPAELSSTRRSTRSNTTPRRTTRRSAAAVIDTQSS